jgi:hypothetical protein
MAGEIARIMWPRRRKMRFPWNRQREQDLDRELRAHLDLEAEEQREAGVSPDQAGYASRRAFGNPTSI